MTRMQTNPSRVNASQEPDWNAIYDSVPAASRGSEPDWGALYDSVPVPTKAPATPPFLEPGDPGYDEAAAVPAAMPQAPASFGFEDQVRQAGPGMRLNPAGMGQSGAPAARVVDLGNGQWVRLDDSGRVMPSMELRVPEQPNFIENVGRGFTHSVAMSLPRGVPGVEAWQDRESVRSPGDGVGGFLGQAAGSLAGMVNPKNAAETGLSYITGGALKGAPIVGRAVQFVGEKAGPVAARVFAGLVEEGTEEGVFAALQQIQADADLWLAEPARAFGRTVAAFGVGATGGAVIGGPLGAVGRAARADRRPSDPALVREAVDAMRPGQASGNPGTEQLSRSPSPSRAEVVNPGAIAVSEGRNTAAPMPEGAASSPSAALESTQTPSATPSRSTLESEATRLGIRFTPRTRTVDLRRAVEAASAASSPASAAQPQSPQRAPVAVESTTPARSTAAEPIPGRQTGEAPAPSVTPSPADGAPYPVDTRRSPEGLREPSPSQFPPADLAASQERASKVPQPNTALRREHAASPPDTQLPNQPSPQSTTRQPWEMTRREYEARGVGRLQDTDPLMQEAAAASQALRKAASDLLPSGPRRVKMDTATKKSTIGAAMEYQDYTVQTALKSPRVPREAKDAYRSAKSRYEVATAAVENAIDHRTVVESALREGRPVPPEVLADYPELAELQLRNSEPTAENRPKISENAPAEVTEQPATPKVADATPDVAATQSTPPQPPAGEPTASAGGALKPKRTRKAKATPTPDAGKVKEPWEMTKEEYGGTVIPQIQGLMRKRMAATRGMERAAIAGNDNAVDAYRDDYDNLTIQIEAAIDGLHRRAVETAIAEGKIDSHPDYPELKAEGKAPDAAPASLADRLEAKARKPDAVEEVQQPDDGSDLEPMGQGAGGQGAKWKRSNTPRIEPDPIAGKQPKRLSEMTLDLESSLNANIRKGNPGGRFTGVYKPRSQDTVIRFAGDVDTTAHEISHRIDDTYGLVRQWAGNRQRSPFDAELMPHFSQYGSATTSGPRSKLSYQRAEGVAEWMRAWMVNPDAAKKAAPQFAAHFEQTVPADVRAKLEAFGRDIREWYGANPVDQAIANVRMDVTNPGLAAKVRESIAPEQAGEYKPGFLTRQKTDWQDDLAPVWEAIALSRELRGVDPAQVLPSKDAQTMTRNWAGVDRKVLEVLNHGPRDAQGKKIPGMGGVSWLFEPIANQPKKQLAADYRAVIATMLSERVVDRTAKMQADADAIKKLVAERDQLAKQIAAAGGAANAGGSLVDRYRQVVTGLRALRKKLGFQGDIAKIDAFVQQRAARMAGIGAHMVSDLTQARRILAEVAKDPARKARIDEAARRYRQWSDAMLRYSLDKGRISKEQYDAITAADDAYVSFARVRTPEEEVLTQMYGAMAGGKKLGSAKDVTKKFTGSTRELENPYASLLNNTHRIIKEVDRNEALRLIADEFTGNRKTAKAPPIDTAQFARKVTAEDPNAIRVFRDGKAEYWQFAPAIHEAIKGIGEKYDTPTLLKPLRMMASILRSSITNLPPFMIRNALFRDPMSRAVLSRTGGEKLGHLTYMVRPDQYRRDVAELRTFGGALFGNYQPGAEFNHKFIAARMREMATDGRTILTTPARLMTVLREKGGGFTEASETVGRLAEYKSAYRHAKTKLGYNDYDAGIYAASQARGLLDYAVAGRRIRPIAQYVAFLNANIQGLAREVGGLRERPARVAAKWAAYVLAPSLLTYWWAAQSDTLDEYRELPAYRRDFFMNFKIGPDTWLSIPKPFSLGVMASGVERAIDAAAGNPEAFRGYAGSLAKSLVPVDESVIMIGAEPVVEQLANRDFFRDRNIVPPWEEDLDVSLREGTSRASRVGQAVQSAIGMDSRRVDHLAQSMFGSAGKIVTMASDLGRDDKPGQTRQLASFLSGIVTTGPGSNAQSYRAALDELRRSGKQGTGLYRDLVAFAKAYGQAATPAERDEIAQQILEITKQVEPMIAQLKKEREGQSTAAR